MLHRDEYRYPIYTLRAPGPRLYIVNSLDLIKRLDRHIETVAFSPIEIRVADKVMGIGKAGVNKMSGDHLFSKNGYDGLWQKGRTSNNARAGS